MTASSSTSTLEKILQPLREACEDRKRIIDNKFEEECAWLRQELLKIRNMVDNKSPEDDKPIEEAPVVTRTKRKSSEGQEQPVPSKKKPSLAKDELDDELNQVPLDELQDVLTSMKVVELKEALRARGETVQSRALKKDLVQQLLAAITAHHEELERRRKARSRSRGGKVEVVELEDDADDEAAAESEVEADGADELDVSLTQETTVSASQATEIPAQTSEIDIIDCSDRENEVPSEVVEMAIAAPEERSLRRGSQIATSVPESSVPAPSMRNSKASLTQAPKPKSAEEMETQIKQRMQERLSTHSRRQSQKDVSSTKVNAVPEPAAIIDDDAGMDISTTPVKPEKSENDDSGHERFVQSKPQQQAVPMEGGPPPSPLRAIVPKIHKTASTGSSSSSSAPADTKRPLNLIGGLHSLTSLVKKSEPAQEAALGKSAIPSKKLTALRQAEEAKRMQEQKEEERRKRKEQMEQRRVQKLQTGGPISATAPSTSTASETASIRSVAPSSATGTSQTIKPSFTSKLVRPVRTEQPTAQTATSSVNRAAPSSTLPVSTTTNSTTTSAAFVQDVASLPKPIPATEAARPVLAEIKPIPSPHTLPPPSKFSPQQPISANLPVSESASDVSKSAGVWSASPAEMSPPESYDISDRGESDEEDGSDEDENTPRKPIPEWARGQQLRDALEKQFGPNRADPDSIFPEVHTCDLEDIFDMRKKRYVRRTSSANWTLDQLTIVEKRNYRTQMGF